VLDLVDRYFGAYSPSANAIPEVYTDEPPQQGERRFVIRRVGELALVQIAFHTPAVLGQLNTLSNDDLAKRAANPPAENDIYPLVILSAALSNGVTSRLYQALVEKQLAVHANSNADQHRDPGLFNLSATVVPGVEPMRVEEVMLAELTNVADSGLTEAELEKGKQQILAQIAFNRDGTFNIAEQMSEAEAVADWRFYKDFASNISKVTTADVQRVAKTYFHDDNRTVGYFIPRDEGGGISANGGDPAHLKAAEDGPTSPLSDQFDHKPTPDAVLSGETQKKAGSNTPQKELPAVAARVDKSSDGPGTNVPMTAGSSNFVARVFRNELPNGATLLVLENHATPTVAYRASLRAGAYFEPRDKPGLARVTMEMLQRGTKKRKKLELASEIESVGAEIDWSAGLFAINVTGRSLASHVPLILRTLAEELREPSFPADELEKLKQQMIAAIQEQQSNTRYRAYERFSQLVFTQQNPFYIPTGEELIQSLKSITVDDVRRFYTEHYGGRSLILALVGDVKTDDVKRQFEEAFADFAGPASVEVDVTDPQQQTISRREVVLLKDKASVDILLGSAAPLRRRSEDYYAAVLANSALGQSTLSSRLGLQVRDRDGLTYGIGSTFRAPSLAAGPWFVSVSVNPNNVERAINSALQVLRDYVENGIRPDELADEKSAAIGAFKVGLASNAGLAEALWNAEFFNLGIDYIDRYPQLIQWVTVEQVNAAIRKYFRPEQLTIVAAGDLEGPKPGTVPIP
jgi:zinc protease